jgi:hypothetical protein
MGGFAWHGGKDLEAGGFSASSDPWVFVSSWKEGLGCWQGGALF